MAKIPTVAIIGRPNTGKSTLFNRLVGWRKSIVSDVPGTTRDHVAHRIDGDKVDYLVIDTAGIGGVTDDKELEEDVQVQSMLALEHADLIVLTINSQEELTSSDYEVVDSLRKNKRGHVPIIIALTKCDNPAEAEAQLPQGYELGIADDIIPTSATHAMGIDDLQSCIEQKLTELHFEKQSERSLAQTRLPKIAIIGKPNVGKSSLVNAFMSESQRERSPLLVSEIPGTTRDAIDVAIRWNEQSFLFVDTAGIQRRRQTQSGIELFAYFRSIQAVSHADICVLVLDALVPISKQDKRIAGMAVEEGKGLIILVNKIDLISKDQKKEVLGAIERELAFCRFAPVLPCSAETKEGLLKIFPLIEMVDRNRVRRIPTREINQWFHDAVAGQPMASLSRSKHITQADGLPPTFVIFVKDPKQVQVSQLRYMENHLRKTFGFEGTPVRWVTKTND